MCKKCDDIDIRAERYRHLAKGVTDKAALESIEQLIADLEYQKQLLHSERDR
jgi:hypothetical protein